MTLTRMCCVCRKIEQDGRWVSAVPSSGSINDVTHGYCPDCFEKAMLELEDDNAHTPLLETLETVGRGWSMVWNSCV